MGIISLLTSILIIAIFWGFYSRVNNLINDQLLHESRAFFQEIVQTRHWIINQQGVYIKMRPDMRPDPYLDQISGLKTTITDQEGQRYVLRNHAVVTRMISALGQKDQNFSINITSRNSLNPDNKPDEFERTALDKFETGTSEYYRIEHTPTGKMFRFMAPLITQQECLPCHGSQGYKLGDIRGGISISLPAQGVMHEITETRIYTIIAGTALLSLLLSAIIYISHHFVLDLKTSEKQLVELATTDSLTGILNRGEGMRRFQQEISRSLRKQQPLSIIIIDIDHFKVVNDNYGHQVGDQVIQTIVASLEATLRNYDIICRYGGEEFLVLLPTTEMGKALETAERLRQQIAETAIAIEGGKQIKLTISLGVSSLQAGDSLDSLIYRADNALYIAKEEGRNQVQFIT
ncbi:MAG: diguanylate cyclase [Desulfobulbaceae bacterium]|nr:diguanylate cyclase [Desulfobulbaceae bacterium]